ncbi:MAG: sigma-70 family RNA polymerase sigma factor [Bauldia sp.]
MSDVRAADLRDADFSALMAVAQSGDQTAYRRVLQESVSPIRHVARRAGVPADALDDVVQEVLFGIHQMLATFDPSRSYLAWLSAIAKRRSIDYLRRQGRRAIREVHDDLAYENHPDGADMAAETELHSEERRLGELVATLPDGQRQAVQVLAIAGNSLEEGAAATGRTKGALKVNFHRAIQTLRSRLSGEANDARR